jgi:hypothetical protein
MTMDSIPSEASVDRVADPENLGRLERWAQKVLDESSRLPDDLPEAELQEYQARWYADYFTLEDGWVVAEPDDPSMKAWLLEEEGMSPELADAVLAQMRELAAAR